MELTETEVRIVARSRFYRRRKPHVFFLGLLLIMVAGMAGGIALRWWMASFVFLILILVVAVVYAVRFGIKQRAEEAFLVDKWRQEHIDSIEGL